MAEFNEWNHLTFSVYYADLFFYSLVQYSTVLLVEVEWPKIEKIQSLSLISQFFLLLSLVRR